MLNYYETDKVANYTLIIDFRPLYTIGDVCHNLDSTIREQTCTKFSITSKRIL